MKEERRKKDCVNATKCGRSSPPARRQPRPATPRLDANVAVHDEALPAPVHAVPVPAQAARAVLPLHLGQLELLQHQLDQHAVVLDAPLGAVRLDLHVRPGLARALVQQRAALEEVHGVKVGPLEAQGQLLGRDARALGRRRRLRRR